MSRSTVVSESSMVTQPQNPRVLIFSQRNIFKKRALFRCPHYEFEDTICKIDAAEILAPEADEFNPRYRIARRAAFHVPVALNSGIPPIELKTRYDLFLAICGAPGDLLMVNSVSNWRDVCKSSVCLIDEIWLTQMHSYRYFLRLLQKFDVVLLYYSQSVKPLSDRIGRKVVFMPPGVDAIAFCPYPERPQRVVDVYIICPR